MDDDDGEDQQDDTSASANSANEQRRALIKSLIRARLARNQHRYGQYKTVSIVVDSGATSHFVQSTDDLPYSGQSQKLVQLPDGSNIRASHKVRLPFTTISDTAREAHVLPSLKGNSLLSVPVLAQQGYTTIFHAGDKGVEVYNDTKVTVTSTSEPVLQGWQEQLGLWRMGYHVKNDTTNASSIEHAQSVYDLPSIATAIQYMHAAAGYPSKATWLRAIKCGNYSTWPGLTASAVATHFWSPLKHSQDIPKSNDKMSGRRNQN